MQKIDGPIQLLRKLKQLLAYEKTEFSFEAHEDVVGEIWLEKNPPESFYRDMFENSGIRQINCSYSSIILFPVNPFSISSRRLFLLFFTLSDSMYCIHSFFFFMVADTFKIRLR